MLSVFFLCAIWCACAILAWRALVTKTKYPLPPSLSHGLPIIGHTPMLLGDTSILWPMLKYISKECMQKGGVVSARIGTHLYYLITDPDDASTAANACIQKHFIYNFWKNWLGDGLITSSGALWQHHRKLLSPAFTVPVIHNFLGIFNHMSIQLVNEVGPHIGKGPFELFPYVRLTAFQTFTRTAFGVSNTEMKDFARKYMAYSDQLMSLVMHRFQNILLHSPFIYKLCGLKKKEENMIKTLCNMANQVIQRKKEDMKNLSKDDDTSECTSATRYKPLISLLIELKTEDTLTEKEIKEEVDTALLAGFDTTSNLLTCIIVLLGSHPEIQQRMYEEIIAVLGADKNVEKDDIKKLVYTEAVIKETLRIYPIGPALLRYVDKDVKLKNYTMQAGSQCVLLPLGIHWDPLWGEDVEAFRPGRWLDLAMPSLGNTAFYGFSLGKRSCIGKTYAMISMKVTLSHFVRRYQVKADIKKVKFKVDMLLKPQSAAITIENRN